MTEETLFQQALSRSVEERASFLDRACAGQPELRAAVEARLAAHQKLENTVDGPPVGLGQTIDSEPGLGGTGDYSPRSEHASVPHVPTTGHRSEVAPGAVIAGRYRLLEVIGEGGMGTVYLADQTEPVKRRVALKVIKSGMDSKAVLARFDAERQALALMDHPNIARVYDGGTTPSGEPFFVMELVQGVPISQFCDDHRLPVRARLELFVSVCHAVQHAHQKGIIHRDLKPANVLVIEVDGRPTPKVIDFGVAKATEMKLTDLSFSDLGAIVGTPAYMSPEQADPSSLDIDTRTDVYALGIMLYELLVGSPPIDGRQFQRGALLEILRMVREDDPPRPSTKLSSAGDLPNIAANRSIEPAKLAKSLQGELDWVVMKAIEKDRARRYETANGLAQDIRRYLADEVVEARPPSAAYRLKKFVRRHKGQVIAAGLVLLALMGGIVGTSIGLVQARRAQSAEAERAEAEKQQRLRAETAEADAGAKKDLAEANEQKARKRLAQIEKANNLLGSIFEDLDPKEIAKQERPLQAILVEKLDKAVAQLEGESIGDPLVVAAMQIKFGNSLMGLGEPDKAIVVLEKARATLRAELGPKHPDTLSGMNYLASAYQDAGKLNLAVPLFEETLGLRKAELGPDHPDTLASTNNLAAAYQVAGKRDLALPLYVETLKRVKAKLGPEHPSTLTSMNNLAGAYREAEKPALALPLYLETLKLREALLGPHHPDTLISKNDLALTYRAAERMDLALPLYEETLKLAKTKLGSEHLITLSITNNLALAYTAVGKHDLALPLYEETLRIQKLKRGPDHPHTLGSMNNLAGAYLDAGKRHLALPLFEETLKLLEAKLGLDHPTTLTIMHNLAILYRQEKKFDRSIVLFEESLKLKTKKIGRDHPSTLNTLATLGLVYMDVGRYKDAVPLFEEAARAARDHPQYRWVGRYLLDAYAKAGENVKLANMLLGQLPEARKVLPKEGPELAGLLAQIGVGLLEQKKWAEAEPLLRECLAIREKTQPEAWTTANTKSLLGGSLLGQKKYADAEPLLVAGYEGMRKQADKIPPQAKDRPAQAVKRLVELYEASGKKDNAAKWRKVLEALETSAKVPENGGGVGAR